MRLALLMGRTLAELQDSMSAEELKLWLAYDRIHPLPDGYWQAGLIASTMVNMWSKERTTPQDFIPARKPPTPPEQVEAKNLAIMKGLWAAQQAKQNRGTGP